MRALLEPAPLAGAEQLAVGPDASMLETTASKRDALAGGGDDARPTLPSLGAIRATSAPGRKSTPSSSASVTSAFGHGAGAAHRVPDALARSACARCRRAPPATRRGGADVLREVVEHLRHARVGARDARTAARPCGPCAGPSRRRACRASCCCGGRSCRAMPSTIFQKKNRSEMPCRRSRKADEVVVAGAAAAAWSADRRCGAAMASTSSTRSSTEPSSKKHRHCGSSRTQVEVLVQVAAGLGEDALEHPRHGQDRRPHVEAEPVLLQHRRLAAEPGVLLEQRRPVAAAGQGAGRRQAAEAAADDRRPAGPRAAHGSGRVTAVSAASRGAMPAKPSADLLSAGCRPRSSADQPRGDAGAFEDHRQAAAGVRAAADEVDAVQVLEPVPRPQVQHLPEVVGEVERGAAEDRVVASPSRAASRLSRSGCASRDSSMPSRLQPLAAPAPGNARRFACPVDRRRCRLPTGTST